MTLYTVYRAVRSETNAGVGGRMPEEQPELEVDDLVVLLLGAPSKTPALTGRLDGITRLEKLVFLTEREGTLERLKAESADFRAYNYGPFSGKVYQAVDVLSAAGLLVDSAKLTPSDEDSWETEEVIGEEVAERYATRNFELTPRGRKYYDALVKQLPPDTESRFADLKERFGAVPLRALLRYVYTKYDDYIQNSLIRDQVLGPAS
jgi:hypothetical protein